MIGDAPVKTVAAHVHKTAACVQPVRHTIEHCRGVILRVRACYDHGIGFKQTCTLAMEIFICDHVERLARMMQPVGQIGIRIE